MIWIRDGSGCRSRQLRWVRIGIALVFAASNHLCDRGVCGCAGDRISCNCELPGELLRTGGLVWIALLIPCSLVYWELDLGGPAGARGAYVP